MIKFSEESMSKAKKGQKARTLVPNSHIVSAKEKFLKEIKSAASVNTGMIRKQYADRGND